MVSNASEDLPEPLRPVKTTSRSRGMESVTFSRLCSRAPRITPWLFSSSSRQAISMTARPRRASAMSIPSSRQAGEVLCTGIRPPTGDGEAGRGGAGDQAVVVVDHVGFAEEKRALDLHNPADRAQTALDEGPDEIDLELDCGVVLVGFLHRHQGAAHRRVGDLGDDPALHDAALVLMSGVGFQLDDRVSQLDLGDAGADRLPPAGAGAAARDALLEPLEVRQGSVAPLMDRGVSASSFGPWF